MISRSIGFVKRYILLPAVVVLFLMASSVAKPEPGSAWSIEGIARYDGTHRWVTEQVIHWFKQHEWTFNGEPIQFEDWGILVRGSEQPDCAAHGLAGVLTPRPCSPLTNPPDDEFERLEGVYHRVLERQREFCRAYTELDEAWTCDLIGVFNPDAGAEAQAINWANEAKQDKDSDLQKAMRKAGYAIHFSQDAVNPPHVDPWREGLTWTDCRVEKSIGPVTIQRPRRGSPPHTSFERFVDGYVNHRWDNPTEFNLNDNNLTVANIREKILELTAQTDTDWEPDPQSIFGNWQCYDPFEPYGGIESQQTKQKIATALDRAAYLTQLILIHVFDFRPPLAEGPWPMFAHDSQLTGRSPYIGPQSNNVRWTYETGSSFYIFSPVISFDGTIYSRGVADGGGNTLYAINSDGTTKWKFEGPSFLLIDRSSPAIAPDGTIYQGFEECCWNSFLYAINSDGTLKWKYKTAGPAGGYASSIGIPIIGSDGTVYVVSGAGPDAELFLLRPDGSLKLRIDGVSGISTFSTPSISSDGTVYIRCEGDTALCAISTEGNLKWKYELGWSPASPVVGPDGTIYTAAVNSLLAINPDGTFKWETAAPGQVRTKPALASDGTIIVGTRDWLFAVDTSGSKKWQVPMSLHTIPSSSPIVDFNGNVYIGSDDGSVYAFNSDGTSKWKYLTGGRILSSAAIGSDGALYIGSDDGTLYAFGPTD